MLPRCSLTLLMLLAAGGARAQRRPIPSPRPPQQQPDILEQVADISPDGSFHTKYATANGISFEEFGRPKSLGQRGQAEEVQGSASWTSAEGEPVSISWHADENGAVFQGDRVPTAPPLPPLIQRALDYVAANPPRSAEDGAYVADADRTGFATVRPTPRRPRPFFR